MRRRRREERERENVLSFYLKLVQSSDRSTAGISEDGGTGVKMRRSIRGSEVVREKTTRGGGQVMEVKD